MKILVVVDSIDIEDSSGSKANVALINNLVKAGCEIIVYHYTKKNIQLSGAHCFSIPEIKYSLLYFMSRVQRIIQRKTTINLAPFFEKRFGFSFTFFNDTRSIAKALKRITFQTDLVLTLSKGMSFRPHYALLQIPKLQDKWMAYVHDPYPFYFYPKPYKWLEPSHKFKEAFFKKVSQKARYTAFPSQLLQEWMGKYFPEFLKKGILIPHQNAKIEIEEVELPSYFDSSKFNLLHAGNLLDARSPIGLMEGFKLFLERNPLAKEEVRLLLIGPSSCFSKIIQDYQKEMPELIVKNENVNFDTVYQIQKQATVNVILEAKSDISPFLPGKFPHCVEANKMILSLAPFNCEVKRLLGKDYPYWAEVDDVESIATIVEKMYFIWKQNPENLLLNRIDLEQYLSADNLKIIMETLDLTNSNY